MMLTYENFWKIQIYDISGFYLLLWAALLVEEWGPKSKNLFHSPWFTNTNWLKLIEQLALLIFFKYQFLKVANLKGMFSVSYRKYACYAICPHADMPGMPTPFIQNISLSHLLHFS